MTLAKIGRAPVKKAAAAAVASVAVTAVAGALGGGAVGMLVSQRSAYIVLTDRQILLFGSNPQTGGPTKYLASVDRADATASIVKSGLLFLKVQLEVSPPSTPPNSASVQFPSLRLTFPPLPPSLRVTGRQLVSSLQRGVAVEEGQTTS